VFAPAVSGGASSLLLAHNHPSGDPEPSADDVAVTRQLVESGDLLGIPVRDHVVLGDGRYVSLMERGLLGGEAKLPTAGPGRARERGSTVVPVPPGGRGERPGGPEAA
jgi:DNA repair protein RadC